LAFGDLPEELDFGLTRMFGAAEKEGGVGKQMMPLANRQILTSTL
jgi:hypothetical protein